MKLAIYGAGGFGREVLEMAKQINHVYSRWSEIFFIDDIILAECVNGAPVVRFTPMLQDIEVIIAMGEPASKKKIAEKISGKYSLATLIHPDVYIPESTVISKGCIISTGVFISCNVFIDENTLIQPKACIGHDVVIGKHSVISSLVTVGGSTKVGEQSFVGMNSTLKEKITIGDHTIISMGSVVLNDIRDSVIAMGNPARVMLDNVQERVFK